MKVDAKILAHWKERLRGLWSDEKKRINLVVLIGLAGLLLLVCSEWMPTKQEETPAQPVNVQDEQAYALEMETRLEALLAQMEKVGRVKVMVTLENGEENVYATDSEKAADGTTQTNHVLLGKEGLLETIQTPQVLGVAVVCDGGDDAGVQNRISTLVAALTGVGVHHITVTKMASTQ